MSSTMTQCLEKDDVALEIEKHAGGQSIWVPRRIEPDAWIRESAFTEKDARDLHALLGDLFLSE